MSTRWQRRYGRPDHDDIRNDADTVRAVTGMIAGAIYGYKAIPERWRKVLKYGDAIKATAQRLTQN
ncbi:ADP-ribosylglycohydrolase family protein [Mesorhizobium sp. M0488]|uniref:ADP-ribosylglycohydrolase family protein n=1 Tax=unclassified Mesorhizobium TaxID=325217 RepID=UPI00333A240E